MTRRIIHWAVAGWLLTVWLAAAAFSAEPLRFSIAADSRGTAGFVAVMKQLQAAGGPGAFILTPGDMDPAKTTREQLDEVFGPALAWYPVVGNHEVDSKETMDYLRDYAESRLKGKVVPGPQGTQQTTYSFDAGDVHIAVVNAYWDGQAAGGDTKAKIVAPALRAWLEKDLKASTKPWKLVAGHEPAFPQPDKQWNDARHIGGSLDRDKPSRDAFWKVLEEQGVAAYLCGHTHRYSRYQPPGSKVWQIDAAQARGDKDWKFDAFILVTAEKARLKFDVYRNLKEQGKFAVVDTLTIPEK
jgi:hypothetical protein